MSHSSLNLINPSLPVNLRRRIAVAFMMYAGIQCEL